MKIYKFIASACLALFVLGCAEKSNELYNLSQEKWFEQILQDIKNNELEDADKHYNSMASEHIASPLLEQILLILAQAHANQEEYLLADAYLDQYIKRYGDNGTRTEFVQFLKIKAKFDSFAQPNRNQKLMQDSVAEIQRFLHQFPNSQYKPLVQTMLTKFKLAIYNLNQEIKDLYKRTGKEKSAEIYEQKLKDSGLNDADPLKPELPFYRKIFE